MLFWHEIAVESAVRLLTLLELFLLILPELKQFLPINLKLPQSRLVIVPLVNIDQAANSLSHGRQDICLPLVFNWVAICVLLVDFDLLRLTIGGRIREAILFRIEVISV